MKAVTRILLAACVLALAAAPARAQVPQAWRTDVPCSTATPGGAAPAEVSYHPRMMEVAGCPAARCIGLPDGRRVCSCGADTLVVTRVDDDGRLLNEWTDENWDRSIDPYSLSVTRADLDGDARPELIVALFVPVDQRPEGRTYSVRIVDGADPARPPVRLLADEYSPHGSLMRPAGGGPCRVLATRWQRLRHPRRGEGTYLVGQWMHYRAGRLEHDRDRPVVVRSRETLRGEPGLGPLADLRDPLVQPWEGIALWLPPRDGDAMRGTVLQVRADTVDLLVTPRRLLQLYDFGVRESVPGDKGRTFWLVDRATGRPYPSGYASGDPGWLRGEPVEIIHHRDDREAVHLIVVGPEASNELR